MLRLVLILLAAPAGASTVSYPPTNGPTFYAEGFQCWSGKWDGEPMPCRRPKARPCTPLDLSGCAAADEEPDRYLTLAQAQSQWQAQHQAQAQSQSQTGSDSTPRVSLLTQNAVSYQTTTGDTFLSKVTTVDFFKDCPPDEPVIEIPDEPSTVPLPAGAVLLLSGLGLLWWRTT